jgi:N-acyl-D-amino-acid deacylase
MSDAVTPYDLIIRNGLIVDGSGRAGFVGDVAVRDGVLVQVGGTVRGAAREELDATGLVVTPGFVDVHTHYDGQVTWDSALEPSSSHGVTTIVAGSCGVGFAPVVPERRAQLIELMEGVEDIPGTALTEGITWEWETFPEYLDALEPRRWSIDVGTQIAHSALRVYVMGDRGVGDQHATAADIAEMGRLVRESIDAGALGFSTSRTMGHTAPDGTPVPGTFAAEDELMGIAAAMSGSRAVFELAPRGASSSPSEDPEDELKELDWMRRLSLEFGLPVSPVLLQIDSKPDMWREILDAALAARADGAVVVPQVANRPFGMLIGFPTNHAFQKRPTFVALSESCGSFAELAVELAKPEVKAAILAEDDLPYTGKMFEGLAMLVQMSLDKLYVLGDEPNYEPTPDQTVAAIAAQRGVDPMELLYDLFLERDGGNLLMLPIMNFTDRNLDVVHDMITHPASVLGLGDGGAHCGMICDASMPTFLLSHWVRDRDHGRIGLEAAVRMLTSETAELFGLGDRGVLAAGKKADINVIDVEHIGLERPRVEFDLPAGGRRLLQGAHGYRATVVSGVVTRRDGVDTGERPGRLVRGAR